MYLVSNEISSICKDIGVNFKFASITESANALSGELRVPYLADKVYPALIVSILVDEDSDNDQRHKFKFKLKGWLVTMTDQNYTTDERLTKVYQTELYPLFDALKNKLQKSINIISYYGFKKIKSKNIYYRKENGTQLNEAVDAIEFEIDDLYRKHD